jgi:SAM-dependent methyltransferase
MGGVGSYPERLAQAGARRIIDHVIDATARQPRGWVASRCYRGAAGAPRRHEDLFRRVVAAVKPTISDSCLDIGCGGGRLLELMLAGRPYRVVGVDHSAEMIRASRRRNWLAAATGRVQLHHCDAHDLPWPADCFSILTCVNTLHFLACPEQALSEWVRVLRPGGRLAVASCRGVFLSASGPPHRLQRWSSVVKTYSDEQLRSLLSDAGLAGVSIDSDARGRLVTAVKPRGPLAG